MDKDTPLVLAVAAYNDAVAKAEAAPAS